MTPEDRKMFEDLLAVFVHPGWRQFQTEIKANHDSMRWNMSDSTKENFETNKGFVNGLSYVLNFEALVRQNYDNRLEDDRLDALDEFGKKRHASL